LVKNFKRVIVKGGEMIKEKLREIVYGGIYKADPGSDNYKYQDRALDEAIKLMEAEMAKKKKKLNEEDKDTSSFREKMVKKGG
jgi:hypothetical protein